jgi:lipopolysaccharide/colanic/teichoic acid biosynthesis glycosyltransferase
MIYYTLIGFFAAVFGYIFSPKTRILCDLNTAYLFYTGKPLVFAVFLGVFSRINGLDRKMAVRSMIDFAVNAAVVGVLGVLASILFLYSVFFDFVGRWVALYTFSGFVLAVVAYGWCQTNSKCKKICVYSDGVDFIRRVFEESMMDNLDSLFEIKEMTDTCFVKGSSRQKCLIKNSGYVVPILNKSLTNLSAIKSCSCQGFRRIFSLGEFCERELEIVYLDAVQVSWWWEFPTALRRGSLPFVKRLLDLVGTVLLGLPAVFVILVAGVLIKLGDNGPVFYTQVRLGQYGKPYKIFKLRTMRVDSEVGGVQWAVPGDARVTWFGRILRATRMDELPQLWNILIGDMSLVGPRPERPELYDLIQTTIPRFGLRLACKPGLSGWAQVNCAYASSVNDSRVKLSFDLFYIKNASFLLDIRIMTRTIVSMVRGAR